MIEELSAKELDLVARVERSAARRHRPGLAIARLVMGKNGSRLLLYDILPLAPTEDSLQHSLRAYHRSGGKFSVYLIPIGPDYKVSSDVRIVKIPPGMPYKYGGEDGAIITHLEE